MRCTKLRVVKVGVCLLKVVVAYALEEGHSTILYRLLVLCIQLHVVEHHITQRHANHITRLAQVGCRVHYTCNRLLTPAFHIVRIKYLRVAYGYIVKAVGYRVAAMQHKACLTSLLYCLDHWHIISTCYTISLRQYILARCRYGHKLAYRRIGSKLPHTITVGSAELTSIVHHNSGNTLALIIYYTTLQHQRLVGRLTTDKTNKQHQSQEDSNTHKHHRFSLRKDTCSMFHNHCIYKYRRLRL